MRLTTKAELDNGEMLLTVCEIAGAVFQEGAKEILKTLQLGTELNLVREADNEYDCNAVSVHYGEKLGYVPGASAAYENKLIALLLDHGIPLVCIVRTKGDPKENTRRLVTLGIYVKL